MPEIATRLTRLEKFAEAAITVGVGLAVGQDLVISGSTAALPFTRLATRAAYGAGAGGIVHLLSDDDFIRARYDLWRPTGSERADGLGTALAGAFAAGAAHLMIVGTASPLLASFDRDRVVELRIDAAR